MSREVQILRYCDGNEHHNKEPATVERIVSVDGGKPILLDLCDRCDKVVQAVQDLLAEGIEADKVLPDKPEPKKRQRRKPQGGEAPVPLLGEQKPSRVVSEEAILSRREKDEQKGLHRTDCKEPGCVNERTGRQYVAPTRSALGQHIKQKHHKLLSDYDWSE